MSHNERCKECKKTVFELLATLFGEVKMNYNLQLASEPEDFKGTHYYADLQRIFSSLQNSRGHKNFVRRKKLPNVDFFVIKPGFIVEFDESQHFTEQRMISLKNYPADLLLGYDRQQWIDRCGMLRKKDNDPPFRDEQRAWYDTLRDFAPEILNLRPTVRLFSKDRVWCELNPKNTRDLESFKKELFYGRTDVNNAKRGTQGLRVGLVSMVLNSKNPRDAKSFLNIVNAHEELDIIIFPGWTLSDKTQLALVKNGIKNKNSLVVFEVRKDFFEGKEQHRGYFIKDGVLRDKGIVQRFATSSQINQCKDLMKPYLDELKNKRIIEYKGRKICWLICGEINVLRNIQNNHNKVEFRFSEDKDLKREFQEIYDATDIFINPTHTIMGNQGKLAQRRKFLSQKNKVFCSVSNADTVSPRKRGQKLTGKAAQYLYENGQEISGKLLGESDSRFILKEYDIFRN